MKWKKKKTPESKVQKRRIPLFSSIRFRIMSTIGIAVFIAVAAVLIVVTVPVRGELDAVNTEYLYNQTFLYGQKLETAVNLTQFRTDIRKVPFRLKVFLEGARLERCKSSYCFLVREDGIVLLHPDLTQVGRQVSISEIKTIAEGTANGNIPEPDIITYEENGVDKIASYYASNKGFVLVIAVDRADFFHTINRMTMIAIFTAILIFAMMLAFGLYQSLRITKPIETVSDVVDRIGSLDFTEDARADKLSRRKDETGAIAHAVSQMRKKLTIIIEEIKSQSEILYRTSNELNENAMTTNQNVSHIETAVGEIATGANETIRVNQDVGIIGDMIVETGTQVAGLSETATEMQQASEQAFSSLTELIQINEQTANSIDRIYEQTNQTYHAAERIAEAAGLIASIASQTNLLSLNANIEAARAGEAGRGFAIVATEVQKLAEESAASAKSIDAIIQELVANSTKAVEIMDEVRVVIEKQNEVVNQTETAFERVQNGINGSLLRAESIRTQSNQLDEARINITSTVESLSEIASENATRSQDTSGAMSEILSALGTMSDGIESLHEVTTALENSVKEINI